MNTIKTMNTTSENDIAPLIPDTVPQETPIILNKSLTNCNLLECGGCFVIIMFSLYMTLSYINSRDINHVVIYICSLVSNHNL